MHGSRAMAFVVLGSLLLCGASKHAGGAPATVLKVVATKSSPGPLMKSATIKPGVTGIVQAHLLSVTGIAQAQIVATPKDPSQSTIQGTGASSSSANPAGAPVPPQNTNVQGFQPNSFASAKHDGGTTASANGDGWAGSASASAAGGAGAASAARATPGSSAGAGAGPGPAGVSTSAGASGTASGTTGCIDFVTTPPPAAGMLVGNPSFSAASATGSFNAPLLFNSLTLTQWVTFVNSLAGTTGTWKVIPGLGLSWCGQMPIAASWAGWNPPFSAVEPRRGPGA